MNGFLADPNNRQIAIIAIRVQDGLRNQAVASTLIARKGRTGGNRTTNRDVVMTGKELTARSEPQWSTEIRGNTQWAG